MSIKKAVMCFSFRSMAGLSAIVISLLFSTTGFSQSRQQNSPSPIIRNEISGTIAARDLGDSRLTTYYYSFKGERGDIFVNVVTKNFSGDIDIFLVEGLKPKTKITIYADSERSETGRVIYLRKPENLLMRIQGRTPNDDAATYQVKFAGSFRPLPNIAGRNDDELPEIDNTDEGVVKVNSVGTIIEDPISVSKEPDKVLNDVDVARKEKSESKDADIPKKKSETKVIISDPFDPTKKTETRIKEALGGDTSRIILENPAERTDKNKADSDSETKNVTVEITDNPRKRSALVTIERDTEEAEVSEETEKTDPERKPTFLELRRIKLVLILKNGKKIERRMSRVSSVNVFDGVLKVVGIDGKVEKFSILDIEEMTIK
ncbi:MAG: hypothetical protein HKN25_15775 [Pyrinomonadaceae bacterium]|nr:hypothetical protein [Pyrinomonadaceae bacterium]